MNKISNRHGVTAWGNKQLYHRVVLAADGLKWWNGSLLMSTPTPPHPHWSTHESFLLTLWSSWREYYP